MREFRLIFAQRDSDHKLRVDCADAVASSMLNHFGGYTRTDARGGYIMPDGSAATESVFIFDCATDREFDTVRKFADMVARYIRSAMNQESVYFRNIGGTVNLLA